MKIKQIVFFLLLFAIAGYSRERFFEHLNIIMAGVYRGTDIYATLGIKQPAIMAGFSNWSYAQLYYSKYIFTVLWMLVFFIISLYCIKKISGSKFLTRFLAWSYVLLLVVAAILMLAGYFLNGTLQNDEYTLSRWLLGVAQSPIICLILLAAGKLYNPSFKQEK